MPDEWDSFDTLYKSCTKTDGLHQEPYEECSLHGTHYVLDQDEGYVGCPECHPEDEEE